jgi:hypothetical protein
MEMEILVLELFRGCIEFPPANFGANVEQPLVESDCIT